MLQQLFKWADDDISVHDRTGRCCPDYSCCHPELLASKRTRQLFKKNVLMGNNQTIRGMVHFFDVPSKSCSTQTEQFGSLGSISCGLFQRPGNDLSLEIRGNAADESIHVQPVVRDLNSDPGYG